MADYYVKSGSGVTEFAISHAYSLGDKIVPARADAGANFATARTAVWECTTAGTSAAANPTWGATATYDTTTVTSGGATFTARKPGYSSGATANWAWATIYADYLGGKLAAGDRVFLSSSHNESSTAAYSLATLSSGVALQFLSCNDGAAPPTALLAGATINVAGSAISMTLGNAPMHYFKGIKFKCGAAQTTTCNISCNGQFKDCQFHLLSTGASSVINSANAADPMEWTNCDVLFSAAGQNITLSNAVRFDWTGGSLLAGSTSPTTLFSFGGAAGDNHMEGIDLSNANVAINIAAGTISTGTRLTCRALKMPASWSGALSSTPPTTMSVCEMYDFGSTGAAGQYRKQTGFGTISHDTSIFVNGSIGLSHKLVTNASAGGFPNEYLETCEGHVYNATTGTPVTLTIELMRNSATGLKDTEVFAEVAYFGDATSPRDTIASSENAAGSLAAGSTLAAGVGNASWTTTGFANPNSQKITIAFTAQLAGWVHWKVKLCKTSTTVYVHPIATVA